MSSHSHDANQTLRAGTVGWQRGYGVVSFGQRNLPWVLEYIAHQKEHHARSKVVDRLERADIEDWLARCWLKPPIKPAEAGW